MTPQLIPKHLIASGLAFWLLSLAIPTAQTQFARQQIGSFCLPNELGANPFGPLTRGPDGLLYGTTFDGAGTVRGVIFQIRPDGSGYLLRHRFTGEQGDGADPYAGLISASDGQLYGTTASGGQSGQGALFRFHPGSGTVQVLHSFPSGDLDGTQPYGRLLEASDGTLYGTTQFGGASNQGVIFAIQKNGSGHTLLHQFASGQANGSQPSAGLLEGADGRLYGTTHFGGHTNRGTVFRLGKDGSQFTLLHSFGSQNDDGANPFAGLVQGPDDTLYGATSAGGPNHHGTLFALDPDGQSYRILHAFSAGSDDGGQPFADLFLAGDGRLYGTTAFGGTANQGIVFSIRPDGSDHRVLHAFTTTKEDGALPYSALIDLGEGVLAGTTWAGGSRDHGTVYRLDPGSSNLTRLHSFARGADAVAPYGTLTMDSNQVLHGTTWNGGDRNQGTVFRLQPDGTAITVQRSLDSSQGDGINPVGGLIEASDGQLYGTTLAGGIHDRGAVFAIHKDGTGHRLLRNLGGSSTDSAFPYARLFEASNGSLYGTAAFGGNNNRGTIFRINRGGGNYSVLHRFGGAPGDGAAPYTELIEASDGSLYGTTARGGASNVGTLFRINRNGSGYRLLYSFEGDDHGGANPYGGVIESTSGTLYGMTYSGGLHNLGTLYRINKDGSNHTVLHHFAGPDGDGSRPGAGARLVVGLDGALYGTTYAGGQHDQGTVFRIQPDGSGYRVLHSFHAADGTGANPYAGLTRGGDGMFYGSTQNGGIGCGTIFRIVPAPTLALAEDLSLLVSGPAGYSFRIQYLEQLESGSEWQTLTTITFTDDDPVTVPDPSSGASSQRFYRGSLSP
jgi:uncharacterized repeat protein (TIGR03803 family)